MGPISPLKIVLSGAFLALLVGSGTLGYFYVSEHTLRVELENRLRTLEIAYTDTTASGTLRITELETALASTTVLLRLTEEAREKFQERYEEKEDEVDTLAKQVRKITGTVGTLEKLAETDPELLMKYSKVYFLNEHYTPAKLSQIDTKYSAVETDQYLESRVYAELKDMLNDAADDDVEILVRSAYRSFDTQKGLKSAYSVSYGSGANTFSADQGYSEHQLGTTIDLTSPENGKVLAGFDTTKAFQWLEKNAHKYGFTLSYPKNNAYYIYEPWHWRYVGRDLASDLHEDGKYFYDLDQREIDEYLISVFE